MSWVRGVASVEAFVTADGSTIRELARSDRQTLAEATVHPGAETAEHYHPVTEEIYTFLAGSGRMRFGAEEAVVRAGDTVLIPPGTVHKLWNTSDSDDLVLLCCCVPPYSDEDTVLTGR